MNHTTNLPAIVDFHGTQLLSKKLEDGTIVVAMRPIVLGMGLSWPAQRVKLEAQKEKFNCSDIAMVAADGKERLMLAIPLTKLDGWLFSINPANVPDPAVRAVVELYQAECFQALYDYWHKGEAINPRGSARTSFDPAYAKRHLDALKYIERSMKASKWLDGNLHDCRVAAVTEAMSVYNVDLSSYLALIPKEEQKQKFDYGRSVIAEDSERDANLADAFFSALRALPSAEQAECLELKDGRLLLGLRQARVRCRRHGQIFPH